MSESIASELMLAEGTWYLHVHIGTSAVPPCSSVRSARNCIIYVAIPECKRTSSFALRGSVYGNDIEPTVKTPRNALKQVYIPENYRKQCFHGQIGSGDFSAARTHLLRYLCMYVQFACNSKKRCLWLQLYSHGTTGTFAYCTNVEAYYASTFVNYAQVPALVVLLLCMDRTCQTCALVEAMQRAS